ncbi:MAG: inositol monophosphatase family protein [Candidatus Bipolaricaulis sp.]|nr:inositol monophosphatase family protein [Candidatus Bipolaricaulis sp.]
MTPTCDPSPTAATLRDALAVAVDAARRAGTVLRRGLWDVDKTSRVKAHRHDPVTVYDCEAERILIEALGSAFPTWGIVSEEGTNRPGSSPYRWIVDPLDGTNNLLRGVPHFATSIGLADDRGPALACIYDPCRDELYTAIRGQGARVNDRRIEVSRFTGLDGAVIGVGFATLPERRAPTLEQLPALAPHVRSLRLFGSAVLDLAYVAAGRFDAVWYQSLHDWDVAAGRLLVTEAGGAVTALDGSPLIDPESGLLASNGLLHPSMLTVVRPPRATS